MAEVEILLTEDSTGWSPYIALEDVYRLDDIRDALKRGDLQAATRMSKVYTLTPVAM